MIFEPLICGDGILQRPGEALEDRFYLVVIGSAVHHPDVDVGQSVLGEAVEEVFHQFDFEAADATHAHTVFVDARDAPSEIKRDDSERLVHRLHEVSSAINSFPVTERLIHHLAKNDTDVFDSVMLIDIEVSLGT